jgi:hypothetical protein
LWHLLARVDDQQRVLVYDPLSQFVLLLLLLRKKGFLRLDQPMLDLWWNELGFHETSGLEASGTLLAWNVCNNSREA